MTTSDERVSTGQIWTELTARIGALGELVVGADVDASPSERAEGLRYLTRFLAAGIAVCVAHDDADYPELGHMIENRMSWGLDNPDCLYSYSRVRGDATYRIAGRRGSATHLEFQVNSGHFGDGNFAGWQCVGALDLDDLDCDDDGAFELILSPEHHVGNWIPLDERAGFLLLRQYFDDWEHERPADVVVERVGAAYPPPAVGPDQIAANLDLLMTWLETGARCWADLSRGFTDSPPGDIAPFRPPDDASGLGGQAYGMGGFSCLPGEAVILELTPPRCRQWSISLCNQWWESVDYDARQSSLNGAQARADDDGVARLVIGHEDPGIANWLDPGASRSGTIAVRFLRPEVGPDDQLPVVSYRTVPADTVSEELPASTPTVTPEQRRLALERRRRAVQRRYRT